MFKIFIFQNSKLSMCFFFSKEITNSKLKKKKKFRFDRDTFYFENNS